MLKLSASVKSFLRHEGYVLRKWLIKLPSLSFIEKVTDLQLSQGISGKISPHWQISPLIMYFRLSLES
jgi:hypothetical protein